MQLNNLTTSINNNSINTNQGPSVSSTTDASVVKSSAGSYSSGQLIEGKITDITNQQVSLQLNDGTTLSGRLTTTISQAIGDSVTLLVVDNNPKTLILKLVEDTSSNYSANAINKALEAASLTKTEKNQTLIKALLTHQMSIDKATIQTLLRQMSVHHNVDLDVLVQMNKNNIPVTTANIEIFLKSIHMEHNILHDMGSFVDASLEGLKKLTNTNETHEILGKLIELATNKNQQGVIQETNQSVNQILNQQQSQLSGMESSLPLTTSQDGTSVSTTVSESSLINTTSLDSLSNSNNSPDSPMFMANPSLLETTLPADTNSLNTDNSSLDAINSSLDKSRSILLQEGVTPSTTPDTTGTNTTLHQAMIHIANKFPNHATVHVDELTPQKLLISIKEALPSMESVDIHELLRSNEFSEVLKESIKDTWSLSPEDFAEFAKNTKESNSISEHIKQLFDNSNQILHMIKDEISGTQSKMSETKDFMGNFNTMFQYLPLPLKLFHNQTAGELYVYKKKQSNVDSNNVSVLLHLDMDHLGKTDVHINLKDNILYNKFYFETLEVEQLVSQYIRELDDILNQKGYIVTNEIILRGSNSTPIKDVLEQELKVEPLMKYNFDLKA